MCLNAYITGFVYLSRSFLKQPKQLEVRSASVEACSNEDLYTNATSLGRASSTIHKQVDNEDAELTSVYVNNVSITHNADRGTGRGAHEDEVYSLADSLPPMKVNTWAAFKFQLRPQGGKKGGS